MALSVPDPYLDLARKAIEVFVKTGRVIKPLPDLPAKMRRKRAGVFVSIHQKDGSLRGCIGTFLPHRENIAEEIIANAVAAASQDPRFEPITPEELNYLEISVDVLSVPRRVADHLPYEPQKYGLIVTAGDRRGLLLPDIPGVETVKEQEAICRQKAGLSPQESVRFEIFTVERHSVHE